MNTWPEPLVITTERLVVRRVEPEDVPGVHDVILRNYPRLQEFLPWAHNEPATLDARIATFAFFRAEWREGNGFNMGMFDRATGAFVGGHGLKTQDAAPTTLEIGYWIDGAREGEGLVREASAAVAAMALSHMGADAVEIMCDPANLRSAAVPESLGWTYLGVLDRIAPLAIEPEPHRVWETRA